MPNSQRRSFPHPRTARAWLLSALGLGVAVGAAGMLFIYFVLFSHSAPAPLALTSPAGTTGSPALTSTEIPGTWTVASKSVAGYRVRERLAFLLRRVTLSAVHHRSPGAQRSLARERRSP